MRTSLSISTEMMHRKWCVPYGREGGRERGRERERERERISHMGCEVLLQSFSKWNQLLFSLFSSPLFSHCVQ